MVSVAVVIKVSTYKGHNTVLPFGKVQQSIVVHPQYNKIFLQKAHTNF